jgi:8-oxo-dGTP pyrophosphatase MutT (NUDIX family)
MTVKPKDAATVILLRRKSDTDKRGFEVLMVLRHPKSAFVPNSYVFPGGIFEEDDYTKDIEELCTGMDHEKARSLLEGLSSPEIALGAWVAGIRETFEEVGVLLAYRSDGSLVKFDSPDIIGRFRTHRRLLFEGKRTLTGILREEGLTLAADRLHYFSHWITPVFLPLRYDVRFFVAEAPEKQEALHDGIELTKHTWISPREALDRFHEGKCSMVLPTLMTMEELSRHETIDAVIRATKGKKIEGILTRMLDDGGEIVEYMPDGQAFRGLPPSVE